MRDKKIFVLGLDGATWDILDFGIEHGELPNFAEIKKYGNTSVLQSTIPPFTLPAWTSMITGVNAGKHGIFDFLKRNGGVVTARDRKSPTIFDILSKNGYYSIAVNIPGTYPPDKIKGVMVSGILTTPSPSSEYVFPKYLKKYIGKFFELSFRFEFLMAKFLSFKNVDRLISIADRIVKYEFSATNELLKIIESPKLIWQVFRTTDVLQHYLYDGTEDGMGKIINHYKSVDKIVGDIISKDDITLLLVSDHGFTPLRYYIYINSLFERLGYFKFPIRQKIMFYILEVLNPLMMCVPSKIWFIVHGKLRRMTKHISTSYFENKAYLLSYTSQGIVVNQESKDKVFKLLYSLKEKSGILKGVYLKEELYWGPCLRDLPDIIVDTKEGYILSPLYSPDVMGKPYKFISFKKADHDRRGIFAIYGSDYKFKLLKIPHIYDVTPSILKLIGLWNKFPKNYFDGDAIIDFQ